MARGNQRDKAREANQKKVCSLQGYALAAIGLIPLFQLASQKSGTQMSGSEMAREKEKVAAKMREKQAAGRIRVYCLE